LKSKLGESEAARHSFAQAAEIINTCAANVTDENLRATFLFESCPGSVGRSRLRTKVAVSETRP
jgi:hypothetical protein